MSSWKAWVQRFLRSEDGGSAAEFGLLVFPMVAIFLIAIQFGVLLFVHNDMQNAARDAVRQMATKANIPYNTTTCNDATNYYTINPATVEAAACRNLDLWSGVVTFTVVPEVEQFNPQANSSCDEVRVTVTAPMADATLFNLFGVFSGRTLTSFAKMRSQWDLDDGGQFCNLSV